MNKAAEEHLLRAAADGDERAFTLLFGSHQEAVLRFAYRMTGSAHTAEDLTQECFLRVLRSAERFDPQRGTLRTYLYATARNLALSWLRRNGKDLADELGAAEILDSKPGPEDLLLGMELAEAVQAAIAALPVPQREALVLIEYEGVPFDEAGRILDIEPGAVKSRVHRARENLRKMLAPYATGNALPPAGKGVRRD